MDFTLDELISDGRLVCETEFSLELDAGVQFDFDDDDQFDLAVLDEAAFTCEGSANTDCCSYGLNRLLTFWRIRFLTAASNCKLR